MLGQLLHHTGRQADLAPARFRLGRTEYELPFQLIRSFGHVDHAGSQVDDRASTAVAERIRRNVDSGLASGQVLGTPTLFIDGIVHRGGYDPPTLLAALAP